MIGPTHFAPLSVCAEAGVYFTMRCRSCRRDAITTARYLAQHSGGDLSFHEVTARLCCRGCGERGQLEAIVRGHWTGAWELRPADWAETVDRRAGLVREEREP